MTNEKQKINELEKVGVAHKTAEMIGKQHEHDKHAALTAPVKDERTTIRQENTAHFTSRADSKGQ